MVDRLDLALQFAQTHPEEAARTLENLPDGDAAELLAILPAKVAAEILEQMVPAAAAKMLKAVRRATAGKHLSAMAPRAAAAVLRSLSKEISDRLLAHCEGLAGRRIRRHLTFPEDAVGAWANADYVAIDEKSTVAQAAEAVRQKGANESAAILVVGEGQEYQGLIAAADLLRLTPKNRLSRHVRKDIVPLLDRTPLSAARRRPDWDLHAELPVVDRARRVVGTLSRQGLARGLAGGGAAASPRVPGDAVMELSAAYYDGMSGLLRTLMEPGSNKDPQKEGKNGR